MEAMSENLQSVPETESQDATSLKLFAAPENHLFRRKYRALSDQEKAQMETVKELAWQLRSAMLGSDAEQPPMNREQSLAVTKLEESVMWAVKAITG
jgi:hypothetical protein